MLISFFVSKVGKVRLIKEVGKVGLKRLQFFQYNAAWMYIFSKLFNLFLNRIRNNVQLKSLLVSTMFASTYLYIVYSKPKSSSSHMQSNLPHHQLLPIILFPCSSRHLCLHSHVCSSPLLCPSAICEISNRLVP